MQALLDWTRALGVVEAVLWSAVVNVVVFALAILGGKAVVGLWRGRPVSAPPPPLTATEVWLAAVCVVLNAAVMFAGWALFRAGLVVVSGDAGLLRWTLDAAVLVAIMDLAMYTTHRLAHHPLLFRLVHGAHHVYDATRPLTLFVLHPLEVLGFGGLWLVVLATHTYSLGGILAYLTINTVFGTLGHVGVEPLPRGFARWPVLGLMGTSTFHARHHQSPSTNFGFYTALWDRLFGTLDAEYAATFAAPPATARESARSTQA